MATVKKSKKKFIVPIAILLVVALLVTSIVVVKTKNKQVEVSLATIATDSIVENVSATGEVTSGTVKEYKVGTVATVKEVFVKAGDEVKEGDLLATFDTTSLDAEAKKLQATYDSAKQSYDAAVKSQKDAKAKLADVDKQLTAAEKQLEALQSAPVTTTKKKTTTRKATTTESTSKATTVPATENIVVPSSDTSTTVKENTNTTRRNVTIPNISDLTTADITLPSQDNTSSNQYGTIADGMAELVETIQNVAQEITNISDSVQATNTLTQLVMSTIATEVANGNLSADAIANAVGEKMNEAIEQGIIKFVDSGVAVDAVTAAVQNVDWTSIGVGIGSDKNVQITAAQLLVSSLVAQKEIYIAASNDSVVKAQKTVMDSSKSALDAVKSAQSELAVGWTAAFDGTITDCSIAVGEQTNMLSSGIKLESLNKLVVTISLGEYDVHKVKVGMPADIKTAYGQYTGEVISIAPTATGGSEGSIMDSVGSMAGISGLSSLTSAGAGVKCEIAVDDPDDNIIVGFQASVDIQTGKFDAVPCVPIESIILEKEGTYVYLYDEEEGTVTKTKIETGAISDTAYEITSGINVGDKIVSIPSADYEEETFEVKVK